MLAPLRLGVDLGREHDPTAMCAIEVDGSEFHIRQLQRVPLGTTYPAIVGLITQAVTRMREHGPVVVYVDATGAYSVIDMLMAPLRGIAILRPVEIAAGDEIKEDVKKTGDRYMRVGKVYLINRLKALLQTGRVLSAKTPEFEALAKELLGFEVRSTKAHDTYGGRSGVHDDLVIALALALLDDLLVPTDLRGLQDANNELAVHGQLAPLRAEMQSGKTRIDDLRLGPSVSGWNW